MSPKVILVYNPIAHGGKLVEKTKSIVQSAYNFVIFHEISPKEGDGFGNLHQIVKDEHPDYIIVAGGDGTLNKYFNYAFSSGISNIPVGIIPSGTANDFAGSLKIPNNTHDALNTIKNGSPHKVDIISIEHNGTTKYCVNVFSSGYLTCVSHYTNGKLKKRYGRLAYFLRGISEVTKLKRMNLRISSADFNYDGKALLILAMNGKTAGKMRFANSADPQDGLIDIIIFKGSTVLGTIISAIKMFFGYNYSNDIVKHQLSSLRIENPDNNETDIDGDRGPSYPINIQCIKGGITIML